MSRSYKHTPRCGDKKSRIAKRYANHVVRRKKLREDLPSYSGYKKLYESWDICDYETVGESFERYFQAMVRCWSSWGMRKGEPFPDFHKSRNDYDKWYIRK